MTKEAFYAELEAMLELEAGAVMGNEMLSDLQGWDSMAVLSFIALADEKFGEVVAPTALVACKTVGDLANLFPGKIA